MKSLTLQEAIKQGYTHYNVYQEEHMGCIEDGIKESHQGKKLVLMGRSKIKFNISAETIIDLLTDYIHDQDEVFEETEELYDELNEADFEKITELVNVGFKDRFMYPTDIELILK